MNLKTLYISDLDGTLLNSEKELSPYTKSAIGAFIAQGGSFTAATARSAASCVKILSGLDIRVPAVLMNGAVIFDLAERSYVKTEIISYEPANSIIGILKEHEISGFMYAVYEDKLITYYENLDTRALKDFYDERMQKYYKSFEQVSSFEEKLIGKNIIYFTLIDDYEKLLAVHNSLETNPDIDMAFYRDNYGDRLWYLEIFSVGASKYNAVKYLRERGHYDRIVGFGDNYNDIPLLKACDEFYSVSNAVDELKALSTAVLGSNTEDAVARFIIEREAVIV
jgi:Cof subfamily protein (haloacid dehalogenase superfamily)